MEIKNDINQLILDKVKELQEKYKEADRIKQEIQELYKQNKKNLSI